MSSSEIVQLSKACNPRNKGAMTDLNGFQLKFMEIEIVDSEAQVKKAPGTLVLLEEPGEIAVVCKYGQILKANII